MLKRTRRRSAQITLVLLGAAALTGCGDDEPERRDLYASKQDCLQDWGDESKCEQAPPGTTSSRPHSGHGYYWGPAYSSRNYGGSSSTSTGWTTARSGSRAVATSSFSRGGFGSSSSAHSSGS